MILTPSEGAMKLLIGEQFARSGCSSKKECLWRGRELLCQITGEDFRYDAKRWHDYLIDTDAGGYTLNGYCQDFAKRIEQLLSDREWLDARAELEGVPDPPSPPVDAPDPAFKWGEKVQVVLNDQNKTARTGWIRDSAWHFKQGEWMYYIETKKEGFVSKRYFGDDLQSIDNETKQCSEQGEAPDPE